MLVLLICQPGSERTDKVHKTHCPDKACLLDLGLYERLKVEIFRVFGVIVQLFVGYFVCPESVRIFIDLAPLIATQKVDFETKEIAP